jgi:hypothetical protein
LAGQEIVFEKRKARDALSASTKHVRGRWWVAGVDLAIFLVGVALGPMIGALFIILTLTLMYLDPREQRESEVGGVWRRRFRAWRGGSGVPAGAAP